MHDYSDTEIEMYEEMVGELDLKCQLTLKFRAQ